jgi:hypothetical protein
LRPIAKERIEAARTTVSTARNTLLSSVVVHRMLRLSRAPSPTCGSGDRGPREQASRGFFLVAGTDGPSRRRSLL